VQGAKPFEVFGEFDAVLRQAAGKCVPLDVERMAKMIDARQQRGAEDFAIGHDAAYRHAAEIDAVIRAFTAYEPRTIAFATRAVKAKGDLERRIDRLRARVREEALGESFRSHINNALGQCKCLVVTHLKRHCEVELRHLLLHGLYDLRVAVSDAGCPEPGERVVKLCTVVSGVVMAGRAANDARVLLEVTIGREWHPESIGIRGAHCRQSPGG